MLSDWVISILNINVLDESVYIPNTETSNIVLYSSPVLFSTKLLGSIESSVMGEYYELLTANIPLPNWLYLGYNALSLSL